MISPEDQATFLCYGICLIPAIAILILLYIESRNRKKQRDQDSSHQ